jgi:hypothetical protein
VFWDDYILSVPGRNRQWGKTTKIHGKYEQTKDLLRENIPKPKQARTSCKKKMQDRNA